MLLKLALSLLFFLPVIESFSRDVSFMMLVGAGLLLGVYSIKNKLTSISVFDILWSSLLATFMISTLFSWSILYSLGELVRYVTYFIIFRFFYHYQDKNLLIRRFIVPMLISNSLILIFLSFITRLPNTSFLSNLGGMNLFAQTFGHNRISDFLIFSLPVVVFLYNYGRNRTMKLIWLILAGLFFTSILFSLGRGAMLALSFAFITVFLLTKMTPAGWRYISKWTFIVTSVTIIFLSVSFIYSNFLNKSGYDNSLIKGFYKPAINEQRPDYFIHALKGFSSSPLTGTGLDTFRYVSVKYQRGLNVSSTYVHNHFLEMFQSSGMAGGFIFMISVIAIFKSVFRNSDNFGESGDKELKIALMIGISASALHSLIDYDWHYISVFLIYWMISALLVKEPVKSFGKLGGILNLFLFISLSVLGTANMVLRNYYDDHLKKANAYFLSGNYKESKDLLLEVYVLDRMNSQLNRQISETYRYTGDVPSSEIWLEKANNLNPKVYVNY